MNKQTIAHMYESREAKIDVIRKGLKYQSGTDPCNSVYMGSLATAHVYHLVGATYGQDGFDEKLTSASLEDLDRVINFMSNIILYMGKNPTAPCPICGNVASLPEKTIKSKMEKFLGLVK